MQFKLHNNRGSSWVKSCNVSEWHTGPGPGCQVCLSKPLSIEALSWTDADHEQACSGLPHRVHAPTHTGVCVVLCGVWAWHQRTYRSWPVICMCCQAVEQSRALCQSNSSPFVAASRLYPGARDDFMEKSNVLLQITSLSLWAVNFLPCVSALQRNTGGREYPPFFPPVFGGYLQKGYHVLFPKSKLLKNDSRRVDGSVYYFSACPCKVIYGCLTAASPLLANHRLCRWSKGLICALLFCSRLRWFKAARGWYDYLASTDMCALSG